MNTNTNTDAIVLFVCICVFVCICAATGIAVTAVKIPQVQAAAKAPSASAVPISLTTETWVVVGAGLTAMSCIRRLPDALRALITIREASKRIGGRTTSTSQAVTPVSTETSPWEFGAWAYRPFAHPNVSALLDELGVASVSIQIVTPYTFIWTPTTNRLPYTALPADNADSNHTDEDAVWFAHTGFRRCDVPRVDTTVLRRLDAPQSALLPVGFGWQDVVLRGIGTVPVLYDRRLARVDVSSDAPFRIQLTYASGNVEMVNGVVLTLPPPAMSAIQNLPGDTAALIRNAFTTTSAGVLYVTWTAMDVWWPKAGFYTGMVATCLPIGRICVTSSNDLRCTMSGDADVAFWSNLIIEKGERAAAAIVAEQLSTVFNVVVPLPASVTYKGWMQAVSFWNRGYANEATAATLSRPWGNHVPIWWNCSDLSDDPGWAEGAVVAGATAARNVSEYVFLQQ
jgi:monoamine oxidase